MAHDVLLGTVVVWVATELRQAIRHRSGTVRASWGGELAFRAIVLVGVGAAIASARWVPGAAIRSGAAYWCGLAVLWGGIALRWWSFRTLGRYFTFVIQTSSDQPVINTGPYRFVRHPSYTGLLLAATGASVFIGNWLSVSCVAAALAAGLVYRIRIEERALLGTLGDAYAAYAAIHKRLVPFVW